MKSTALLMAILLLSPTVRAEERKGPETGSPAAPVKKSAAERYIEIVLTEEALLRLGRETIEPLLRELEKEGYSPVALQKIRDLFAGHYSRMVKDSEFRKGLIKLHTDTYTETELEELITFYSTTTGRKSLEKTSAIINSTSALATAYTKRQSDSIRKGMEAIEAAHPPIPPGE